MLKPRNLAVLAVVLGGLVAVGYASEGHARPAEGDKAVAPAGATNTIVYYFHGNQRCTTCRTIEAYASEAVKAAFGGELESGATKWKPTNTDEPGNQHFIEDFQLFTRSLVLVDEADPKRFKNLEQVWQLVRDKPAFLEYVQEEVRAFRKPR